ncbi:MAG TPA: hypothetical protein PKW21_07740 [Rhabdaerophilum sp.]|nr:hypothetical protein [Rhabdaerophilum sp.]
MNPVPEKLESTPLRGARLAQGIAVAALLAIAATFWWLNGPSVFAEMLASAWALCF